MEIAVVLHHEQRLATPPPNHGPWWQTLVSPRTETYMILSQHKSFIMADMRGVLKHYWRSTVNG